MSRTLLELSSGSVWRAVAVRGLPRWGFVPGVWQIGTNGRARRLAFARPRLLLPLFAVAFIVVLPCGYASPSDYPQSVVANVDPLLSVQALVAQKEYAAALKALDKVLQAPHDHPQLEQAQLLRVTCLRGLKRVPEALDLLSDLSQHGSDGTRLSAYQALTDIYLSQGKTEAARLALDGAAEIYPRVQQDLARRALQAQYNLNRVEYEAGVRYARAQRLRLAQTYEKANNPAGAILAYRRLYLAYPEFPGSRDTALHLAELLSKHGDWQRAVAYYLEVLDTGQDRCFELTALLAENQLYLDQVAKPLPADRLHRALSGLNECVKRLEVAEGLSDQELKDFEVAWAEALAETFKPETAGGLRGWRDLASAQAKPFWRELCRLTLGQGLLREGRYAWAVEVLDGRPAEGKGAALLEQRRACLRGQARLGLFDFAKAEADLRTALGESGSLVGQTRSEEGPLLAGRVYRGLALCAEEAGDLAKAESVYKAVGQQSRSLWDKRCAEYALSRLATLRKLASAWGERVVALPDDRTTRGYWPVGYGRLSYILCAQNFIVDRTGGYLGKLNYDFATADRREPGRLWVTRKQDDDPAALWDPVGKVNRGANRDDYGEQRPLGTGPDLLFSVEIPKGSYVLSLYFVNDHNYYEANREYIVSVTDGKGRLQAISEVSSFGGGVYKRFAVWGGGKLQFRIWRNLSMNTLLAGVFLDGLEPPREVPWLPTDSGQTGVGGTGDTYENLAQDMVINPLRVLSQKSRLRPLIARLEDLLGESLVRPREAPALTPAERAAAYWRLSECYRLAGTPVQSEAAFDRYLACLGEAFPGEVGLAIYWALAEGLCGSKGSALPGEQLQRVNLRSGDCRWDRVSSAYLKCVAERCAGAAEKQAGRLREALVSSGSSLSPWGKREAFASLQKIAPGVAAEPGVLYAVALAAKADGDRAMAQQLLTEVLAAQPGKPVEPQALFDLLVLQSGAGRPADVKGTYDRLAAYEKDPKYASLARSGLYQLAWTYYKARQLPAAVATLKVYQGKYGTEARVESLLESCEKH